MRYYYDTKRQEYISRVQLESIFNQLKTEQPDEYNYSFSRFIMLCLATNSGSLKTLSQRKTELEKAFFIAAVDEFDLGLDDTSDSDSIKKEIEYVNKLIAEE